jgi:serine/threonine protein kinase
MILVKGVFVLLNTSLLAMAARTGCFSSLSKVDELKLIEAAKASIAKDPKKSLGGTEEVQEHKVLFDEGVKAVCSDLKEEFLRKAEEMPKETLLGYGGFGTVLEVEIGGSAKAVKYISFERHLTDKLNIPKYKSLGYSCKSAIIDNISLLNFKTNPQLQQDQTIALSVEKFEFSYFVTEIEKVTECETYGLNKIKEDILIPFIKLHFETLSSEIDTNLLFSDHSQKYDSKDHRTFPRSDYCIIDSGLDVYFVMEKLGKELFYLRIACKSSIGPVSVKERILFAMQLLYKAWVVNSLGFTNCDIKLENILFKLGSGYKEVYFVDYGLIQKDKECVGGSHGYRPPETIYEKLKDLSSKWTKFMTPARQQADAFAMGMVLLLVEADLLKGPTLIKKYETINKDSNYDQVTDDKTFHNSVQTYFRQKLKKKYNQGAEGEEYPLEFFHEKLYQLIILKLLNFNYSDRFPISVALFLLDLLYSIEDIEDERLEIICELVSADDHLKLRELLGIDTEFNPEENISLTIQDHDRWHNTSEAFKSSMQDVKGLLGIIPQAHVEAILAI